MGAAVIMGLMAGAAGGWWKSNQTVKRLEGELERREMQAAVTPTPQGLQPAGEGCKEWETELWTSAYGEFVACISETGYEIYQDVGWMEEELLKLDSRNETGKLADKDWEYVAYGDEKHEWGGSRIFAVNVKEKLFKVAADEMAVPNMERFVGGGKYSPQFRLYSAPDEPISPGGRFMAIKITGCVTCGSDTGVYVVDVKTGKIYFVGEAYGGYMEGTEKLVQWTAEGVLGWRAGRSEGKWPTPAMVDLGYKVFRAPGYSL